MRFTFQLVCLRARAQKEGSADGTVSSSICQEEARMRGNVGDDTWQGANRWTRV